MHLPLMVNPVHEYSEVRVEPDIMLSIIADKENWTEVSFIS